MWASTGFRPPSAGSAPLAPGDTAAGLQPPAMPLDGDRGRAGRPFDGGLARQPALCIDPEMGRHGTGTSVGPSSGPARPRPVCRVGSSTGFAGTRLAARPGAGRPAPSRGRAKPGGTLLTPTSAEHPAAPPSIPSKGMPPGEGTFHQPRRTSVPMPRLPASRLMSRICDGRMECCGTR